MHFCSTILRKGVLLFVFPEVLIRLFFLVVYLATPMSAVSGTAWAPQVGLFLVATNLHIIIIKTIFYSTLVDECKPTPMKCLVMCLVPGRHIEYLLSWLFLHLWLLYMIYRVGFFRRIYSLIQHLWNTILCLQLLWALGIKGWDNKVPVFMTLTVKYEETDI